MAENMKMVMAAIQDFPPNHSFAHVPVWNNGPIVLGAARKFGTGEGSIVGRLPDRRLENLLGAGAGAVIVTDFNPPL